MSKTTVERMLYIMQKREMSQAELSKETRIAPQQINRYLDATTPSGANLVKIAQALKTNASFLLGETNYDGVLDKAAEDALAELRRGNVKGALNKTADELRNKRKHN